MLWYNLCITDKGQISFSPREEDQKKDNQSSAVDKLDLLLAKKRKLFQISAIFPFQLAPDILIIDTLKVTIIYNQFFGPSTAETILIEDIGDFDVDISFIFGAIKILSLSHDKKWLEITHLPPNDVIKAKRIVEGLLIAKKEGIDLSEAEEAGLVNKLEELGKAV